jgi:peptidyl-dipeptidase Dcp
MRLNKTLAALLISFMTVTTNAQNPFFEKFNTPHETMPFDRITPAYIEEALVEGMKRHDAEIDAIANSAEAPNFENTILAIENAGSLLERVGTVFGNLQGAETNDELRALSKKMAPMLSDHSNNVSLNEKLFARIKTVYENSSNLNNEQKRLTEKYYRNFVNSGANLTGESREKYRELTKKLNLLKIQFSEKNLNATNEYALVLSDEAQLAGLPESTIAAAKAEAKERGLDGWVFTLQAPSYGPFMKYSSNRDLRRELYMAYNTKTVNGDKNDCQDVVKAIANTRMAIAQLMGYKNYAEYTLKERMAENSDGVYRLLNQLLEAYTPTAKNEVKEVTALARRTEGKSFELMPWDWSYYSNKLQEQKYSLNEEMLRPYFELENVKKGVFGLATRLYGVTFKKNTEIPVYHKDVDAYEVFDKDGSFLAVLYVDFHPRAGKRAGAWMTEYKGQWVDSKTGEDSRPHVTLVMNFTKPTEDKPALLTFYEVTTFLHEFGHGLHGMLSRCSYESISGTNVYRDFVELPSQLMENFAIEEEFLKTFARHYQTGEVIPSELVKRIKETSNFNVGYACLRQLSFGLLDMAWYTLEKPYEGDVREFESEAWKRALVLPKVDGTCMSTQFSHIFSGGYAAGYYGYKWAEVLDADAFSVFKADGIFSSKVAESFRENILSKGSTEHPMTLYKRFRGQEPTIDALLKRNGIKR